MKFEWNSAKAKEIARKAGMKALRAGAEAILTQAIDEAPVDSGTMRRSGTVTVGANAPDEQVYAAAHGTDGTDGVSSSFPGELGSDEKVYISFSTPYAKRQHEDLSLRHPKGGKAKYLEDPVNRNSAKVYKFVELSIKKALEDSP